MIEAEDNIALKSGKEIFELASNTEQHFWVTETGTDTGAHITEVTKEEFLADPSNGGGNLLARSNGIAVRNGLTESAVFGGDLVQIGQSDKCHMEIRPRSMYFRDYTGKYLITVNVSNDQSTGLATVTYNYICNDTTTVYTAFVINEILECYDADTSNPIAVTKVGDLEVTYDSPQQIGTHIILTYTTYDFVYNIGLGTRTNGEAFGADSVVIGNNNAATNYLGIAIGARNKVDGRQAIAIGRHLIAKSYQQLVFGRFNVEDANGDYEFIFGNGTADNARSNALAIGWNGDIHLGQASGLFTVSEETTAALTISGSTNLSAQTLSISKAGYVPLGIVGVRCNYTSGQTGARNVYQYSLSSRTAGAGTVSYSVRNLDSSSTKGTITFEILWVRADAV